ncbi:MAG: NRDE family protein [Saprospiraceae bacterium]|nr:NRDE family protein [Saprospiraceae bacterium]
MCCLTIVKTPNNNIVFTHNRDEQWSRQTRGTFVQEYWFGNKKIWMPKDSLVDGTWIGSDGTRAAAILNGYKKNHLKKEKYRASRGTIIPQFLQETDAQQFMESFDPSGMEPFTLIVADNKKYITEIGWDEKEIHLTKHNVESPLIFSSFTLYDDDIQQKRKNLFLSLVTTLTNHDDLWQFHKTQGEDHGSFINVDYNREISTVAISQIVLGNHPAFYYKSLLENQQKQNLILL